MSSISTCQVSGTLFRSNGNPAGGKSFIVKRVYTTDNLISSEHTIYKTSVDGSVCINLPQGSTAYVYATAVGWDTYSEGTPIIVPYASTADIYAIADSSIDVPSVIPVLNPLTATFLSLSDTPDSYSGQANKVVAINQAEDGLTFSTISISGVDLSGYATTSSLTGYIPVSQIGSFATSGHTHSQYASTASLTGYVQNSLTGTFSLTGHAHSQYALSASLSGYIPTSSSASFSSSSHTHNQYATTASVINTYLSINAYNQDHRFVNVMSMLTSHDTPMEQTIDNSYSPNTVYHYQLVITTQCTNSDMYHISRHDIVGITDFDNKFTMIAEVPLYEYSNYGTTVIITNNANELQVEVTGLPDTDIYWYAHICKIF